jgi:Fe-S cluster biosynthesis and repair protein YggX
MGTWIETSYLSKQNSANFDCYPSEQGKVINHNTSTCLKMFCKQQLLDFDKNKFKSIERNKSIIVKQDKLMKFNMQILDNSEDKLDIKIYINDNPIYNEVSSDFFLPYIGKYTVMIGGVGDLVMLNYLNTYSYSKTNFESECVLSNEKNNCSCCTIF